MLTKNCDNCGAEAPATQQDGNFIDGGWVVVHRSLGFYGGFSDPFPEEDETTEAHLCHDCCVIMMRAMPGLARRIVPGHPNLNDGEGTEVPPCCEWAWTWVEFPDRHEHYRGTREGTWEKYETWVVDSTQ